MTTPPRSSSAGGPATSNKTALRASLKKEDESLAERLVATDLPLVAPAEPEPPVAAPVRKVAAEAPAAAKPAAAKPAAAKPAVAAATAKASKGEKAPPRKAATVPAPAAPAKAKAASKKAAAVVKPQGKVEAVLSTAKQETGKKAARIEQAVGKLEKAAKEKGDKLVRYSVDLLKSEEAAIESLRAELSKAAGWAASKSDILRAGARLFAQQKVEQMKELLAGLAAASKARKKG